MIKVNVLPADIYTIVNKTNLTDQDRKILTILYQPIIGIVATNLYFTFWSFLEKKENLKEYNHYHLMTNMGSNLESIIEAREKLEAIGLIKTYIEKSEKSIKKFVYELYSPLNSYEFISSPLLSTLLINNIGKEEYDKIVSIFKNEQINLDNYKEITCSFQEVFKLTNDNIMNDIDTNLKKNLKNKIMVEANIDINNIISLIPDEMLNKKSITRDIINTINNLSYVYNLNEDDLKEIIFNSISAEHKIDKEKLKINSRNYYEFNHNGKNVSVVYRKQPENLKSNNIENNNKNKMIYAFENTTPYDFLSSKYGGTNPTKTDLKILEYLIDNLEFTPGVVNVLIDYVLKTNDNKLTKSYIETIAGQWKRENITTVSDAIKLARKEYNKTSKSKQQKKYVEQVPNWVNKKIESEIATKEEQEEISKMLKELVGE